MSRDAFEKGMKTRRKVLGDDWVDRSMRDVTAFNAEFQDLITRYAWNEVWNRPRIPHKVRRMMVISTMVALGRWEEFRLHVRAALSSGDLEMEDVKEILPSHVGRPCGTPRLRLPRDPFRHARARPACAIHARTLVIAGAADAGTPPAMAQTIAERIPGSQLVVLPEAAHLSAVEKPAEFAALVKGFLAAP